MFILIKNTPVYISDNKWEYLREELMKNESPEARCSIAIKGSRGYNMFLNRVNQYLSEMSMRMPTLFHINWVNFDFVDIDAKKNISDLLIDYCLLYHRAKIIHKNANYLELETLIKPHNVWSYFLQKNSSVRYSFEMNHVKQIKGRLDEFTIVSSKTLVSFGKNIEIKL